MLRRGGGQEERGWPPGTAALPWVRPLEGAVGGLVVVTGHGKAPVKRGGVDGVVYHPGRPLPSPGLGGRRLISRF